MNHALQKKLSLLGVASLLMLPGCGSEQAADSGKTKYEVAKPSRGKTVAPQEDGTGADAESGTGQQAGKGKGKGKGKKKQVEDFSTPELLSLLQVSEQQLRSVRDNQTRIGLQYRRQQAGNYLLQQRDLDDPQRLFVIRVMIDSYLQLNAMGVPDSDVQLLEFARPLVDDPQRQVAMVTRVGLMSLELGRLVKGTSDDAKPMVDAVAGLLSEFPDEATLAPEMLDVVNQLLRMGRRDEANLVMEQMISAYADAQVDQIRKVYDVVTQRKRLLDANFDKIIARVQKNEPGAMDQLTKAISTLSGEGNVGEEIYREWITAARVLEVSEQYQEAQQLLNLIKTTVEKTDDSKLVSLAEQDVAAGLKRVSLIGRPLQLTGKTARGEKFDLESLRGNVVTVVFWSVAQPVSVAAIQRLTLLEQSYAGKNFKMVGVNVDEDNQQALSIFGGKLPDWPLVMNDADSPADSLATKFGIQQTPFVILLNGDGVVVGNFASFTNLQPKIDEQIRRAAATRNPDDSSGDQDAPDKDSGS